MSAANQKLRRLRRLLWRPENQVNPFLALTSMGERSRWCIQAIVLCNLFEAFTDCYEGMMKFGETLIAKPVWSIFWVSLSSGPFWAKTFFALYLASAFTLAIWPQVRALRIFGFLGVFFYTSILNSDIAGWERIKPNHVYPLLLFLIIFIPTNSSRRRRQNFGAISVVALSQITLLATYFSSAVWRLRESAEALLEGHKMAVGSQAMNDTINNFVRYTAAAPPVLASLFLKHSWLSEPSMALATLFELSSVLVIFRPKLYRPFGFLLVLFHLSFILVLNLSFFPQMLLLFFLLVNSPLAKPPLALKG